MAATIKFGKREFPIVALEPLIDAEGRSGIYVPITQDCKGGRQPGFMASTRRMNDHPVMSPFGDTFVAGIGLLRFAAVALPRYTLLAAADDLLTERFAALTTGIWARRNNV